MKISRSKCREDTNTNEKIENFIDNSTKDIEKEPIDLLKKMLKLKHKDRITIEGIKKHDFYIHGQKKYKELYKA